MAVVLAGAVLLTGCTSGGDGGGTAPSGTSAAARGGEAAAPGAQATVYPVLEQGTAEALPVLGTRENSDFTLALNEVRRVSDGVVLVVATVTLKAGSAGFNGFSEPGYDVVKDRNDAPEAANEFSAVTLTAPGDDATVYQVLRTEAGVCACTRGLSMTKDGASSGVYAYLSAPKDATGVTITVKGFAPFTKVEVAS